MDAYARAHYDLTFKVAFLSSNGDAFQGLFASIMEKRFPADFIRVRPWGRLGDRKNDGYLRSKRVLFQCYAPLEMTSTECVAKINEDFNGALPYWREYFDTWVFVHNAKDGLGPDHTATLLALRAAHVPLDVTSWGQEELRREAMQLAEVDLASMFGPAPSRRGMLDLGLADLVPVLDHISRLAPLGDPDLRPVPADKLQRNLLSDSVGELLRLGMSRADLVRKYFTHKPLLKDQIAEAFRSSYAELRATDFTPDEMFAALQRFAGGATVPSPAHQNAILATLAFFFEECDIFERVDDAETSA